MHSETSTHFYPGFLQEGSQIVEVYMVSASAESCSSGW